MRPSKKLRQLLGRKNKVLAVLGAPNAFHAKIMEANGVEACFVGTSITGGNYTGQPDLGILSMTECVEFAKWIARAVLLTRACWADAPDRMSRQRRIARTRQFAMGVGSRWRGQSPSRTDCSSSSCLASSACM